MRRQFFIKLENAIVVRRADRQSADVVDPPDGWIEVDEATFAAAELGLERQQDGTFQRPVNDPRPRRLSKLAFFGLLTDDEYVALFKSDVPALARGAAMFTAAPDPFNVDDALTGTLLQHCVDNNVLSAPRSAQLLAQMRALSRRV